MSATPLQAETFESKQIDGKFQNSEISYSTGWAISTVQ
ncbi:hypothetical protein JCM19241_131 [Vibrio ishigakensis]|uniref:Uncharacterized protein n=1 Tax=Vibrio ishigakensis TaxID=1481914 RepID=A0A0B8QL81_9VIBR|nr:hypothetical protein JCM19241_131 [Vibrio ishigakensis]